MISHAAGMPAAARGEQLHIERGRRRKSRLRRRLLSHSLARSRRQNTVKSGAATPRLGSGMISDSCDERQKCLAPKERRVKHSVKFRPASC